MTMFKSLATLMMMMMVTGCASASYATANESPTSSNVSACGDTRPQPNQGRCEPVRVSIDWGQVGTVAASTAVVLLGVGLIVLLAIAVTR